MRVVVVGAGVGGLATAIDLAHAGHRVTVCEQASAAGGKCAWVEQGVHGWDAGPSLLTLPHVFQALFARTGAPLEDEVELLPVEPVTRYRFADGSQVELSADLDRSVEALEAWAPGAGEDWRRFMATTAAMWQASQPFLTGAPPWPPRRPAPGEPTPDPRDALRIKPWWTLRDLARAQVRDPRLRMVVERFATYAGGDPRRTPAALAVAGYVEHAFGAWHPRGGMHVLVEALVRRLDALGGELRLDTPVERLERTGARIRGVRLADESLEADAVVAAVDAAVVDRWLSRPAARAERSVSGLALLVGLEDAPRADVHHQIDFPADYEAEFDDLFVHRRPVRDPTRYLCSPDATDATVPAGSLFVLVNAPAGVEADWDAEARRVLDRLDLEHPVGQLVVRSSRDLERETGSAGGAIYGPAPHGRLRGLQRTPWRVRGVDGLWRVGGTVHPGGGLPLVALGAAAVAQEVSGSRPSQVPSAA